MKRKKPKPRPSYRALERAINAAHAEIVRNMEAQARELEATGIKLAEIQAKLDSIRAMPPIVLPKPDPLPPWGSPPWSTGTGDQFPQPTPIYCQSGGVS